VPEEDVESALERARRGAEALEALEARLELETLPVAARTTVVVDDGLITGLTLAAACRWARAEEVARLIAATPVGHVDGLARLRKEADLVVCPHPLEEIAVVGPVKPVATTRTRTCVSPSGDTFARSPGSCRAGRGTASCSPC